MVVVVGVGVGEDENHDNGVESAWKTGRLMIHAWKCTNHSNATNATNTKTIEIR